MHPSAMNTAKLFFDTYGDHFINPTVVDVGAQDINGTIRTVCPPQFHYVGVDSCEGKGVDVVLPDPYQLPFSPESVDIVVCSSVFEHTEMFWLTFLEMLRILKPEGLIYLNAPSNGWFHRHPVDCWRFYPDSGKALVVWAKKSGYDPAMLESFIGQQQDGMYNDFVCVILKDQTFVQSYPGRILESLDRFHNGMVYGSDYFLNLQFDTEDMKRLAGWQHADRLPDPSPTELATGKTAPAQAEIQVRRRSLRR